MVRAPLDDIWTTLQHAAGLDAVLAAERWRGVSPDLVRTILAEAGRFAVEAIAPLRESGDRIGARLDGFDVTMPPGWADTYRRWAADGWNAVTAPEAHGGQGLPTLLGTALLEMWNSGSMAFGIGPTLTMGAVEALHAHADDALKARYLQKLVSGEWMGTMNMTEPQSGSDLSLVRTRAEPVGDGCYRLFGQKIFITFGEHDLAENIVHLVLARLPDAPQGTRGLSLFLVPKVLPAADGALGRRNDVACARLERKLGLHASPTCVMLFGEGSFGTERGALGWLVGEPNKGLACMFTMMNNARLAVGIQGVAVAEAACQKARAYAEERLQGRADQAGPGPAPIARHPDVRRMLLTMTALTMAARSVCYACAQAIDLARPGSGDAAPRWQARADLLTPIAKAFATDIGVEVASLGVQVHGGMGFIEDAGAAVLYRDARIAPIYEGTNGIQAIDLVTRKLPSGTAMHDLLADLRADADDAAVSRLDAVPVRAALDDLDAATRFLGDALRRGDQATALAGATPYLRLVGLAVGGSLLLRIARKTGDARSQAVWRFYAANIIGETRLMKERVVEGGSSVVALP